ncbi:MAG: Gfo/Idh/MocA family oxidoreductase [Woeseiaceae bacterium]|jgi:scyllo-inositol 2-dehydrogenase (NADP+)
MATIKTALLSFGMSGRVFHAPFLNAHPGFELAGSWERSQQVIGQYHPGTTSYNSLEELLGDPTIELVVVNTPTATHYEYARQALEHGKHVLVEKAFTTDAAEAAALRDLAQNADRKLAVFQNRRWDSDFLAVRDVVQRSVLGDIVEANLAFVRYNPELSPKAHKEDPVPGAGIVRDLGPHVIDQALVLFGMPEAVFADIGITRQGSAVDDYFDILLRYPDQRVHVKGGYFFRQPVPDYALFGKLGSFLKTRSDVQEAQLDSGMMPDDPGYGREPDGAAGQLFTDDTDRTGRREVPSPRGNYMAFFDALHRSIAQDGVEPVTASDGLWVMEIIDAAFRSNETGRLTSV